jgi:hypothetical protein
MCSELEWNIFSRESPDFQLILPKLKYFLIWSKSWFRFSATKSCFRLRLELCPGSSFADYGGVSLFPLTTKYLEKFNGNHTYNRGASQSHFWDFWLKTMHLSKKFQLPLLLKIRAHPIPSHTRNTFGSFDPHRLSAFSYSFDVLPGKKQAFRENFNPNPTTRFCSTVR